MPRRVVPTFAVAEARLSSAVERDVVRHDHVRSAADPDARRVDAARREHVELADQGRRVDDDARADDGRDVRVEDARRDEVELEDLVAEHDRVAGVVAALVADDHRDLLGEEVGRLALALVAPLEPDDHRGRHQRATSATVTGRLTANEKAPGSVLGPGYTSPVLRRLLRRRSRSKVRVRLTGRTTRLPRATADLRDGRSREVSRTGRV